MSGAEILGLAASVIQIAELGGKLSVKLFTFTRKVKNANKSIDALSQDIAATGAVLKQLGEAFSKDDQLRVCSQDAINTARALVDDAKKVFEDLEKLIDGDQKTVSRVTIGTAWKRRLKFPFLEPHIEEVQANLERLKSSLLVILNVLIFAEQLRNREALPILNDQRELIRVLAQEKDQNQRRYHQLLKAISEKSVTAGAGPLATALSVHGDSLDDTPINLSTTTTLVAAGETMSKGSKAASTVTTDSVTNNTALVMIDLPEGLRHYHARIKHHANLVQNLLEEIGDWRYNLDHGTRDRMHTGVLEIHWKEWARQRRKHGSVYFERILADYGDIMSFWKDKLLEDFDEADNIGQPETGASGEGRSTLSASQDRRHSGFIAPVSRLSPDTFRGDAFQRADSVTAQLREQADGPQASTVDVVRPDREYRIPITDNEYVAPAGPQPYGDLSFAQRTRPDALLNRLEKSRRTYLDEPRSQSTRAKIPIGTRPSYDSARRSYRSMRDPRDPADSQQIFLDQVSPSSSLVWDEEPRRMPRPVFHTRASDTPEEWYFLGEKPKQDKPAQDISADRDFVFVEKRKVEVNALADDLPTMQEKSNQAASGQSSTAVPVPISLKEQLDPSEQKLSSYERRSGTNVESSPAATMSAPQIANDSVYAESNTSEGVADSHPEIPIKEEHVNSQIPESEPVSQPSLESSSSGTDRAEPKTADSILVLDDVDKLIMQFTNVNGADLQRMKHASLWT